MSREVDEVLAVWRELERVRDALPVGSTEWTFVTREIRQAKRMYRSLTRGVGESHAAPGTSRPTLAEAYDALRRAKLQLESTGAETISREPSP